MIDFDALRKANGSFVLDEQSFKDYEVWLEKQVCEKCGAKYSDRPKDHTGKCLDLWITETLCDRCY